MKVWALERNLNVYVQGCTKQPFLAFIPKESVPPLVLETINDPRLIAGSLLVPEVAAVLVGFDGSFQYWNLLMAASYLANKEVYFVYLRHCLLALKVIFVATNTDENFLRGGLIIPGFGVRWKCLEIHLPLIFSSTNIGTNPQPDTVSEELTLETIKLSPVPLDARVGAVVVGFDINISFKKILKGASYANLPGALFVATNTDEQFPMKGTDIVVPGMGLFLKHVLFEKS